MQETRVLSLGQEDPLEKDMATHCSILAWRIPWTEEPGGLQHMGLHRVGHVVAQLVKNLPAMWGTWVRALGWEDPLEKGKATHSGILAWRIPWTVYSPWPHKE